MEKTFILSVDQSTQGTKALLFDKTGRLVMRRDKPHRQIISKEGWISHDPGEIYQNTIEVLKTVITDSGTDREAVAAIGISNQRETSAAWERESGVSVGHAVVWQCSRAASICSELEKEADRVKAATGMSLSPYFPASKYAWMLRNRPKAGMEMNLGNLCLGTIDSYLVYRLTGGRVFKTDCSNASRTQLMNLYSGKFEGGLCDLFGIKPDCLPEIEDSDGDFGETDLDGFLSRPVPIAAVMGDSHAAMFGQACLQRGMTKATYGTGSSVMMNVGSAPIMSKRVTSSVGFKINHKTSYVLEGNLNYTGAVITWLKNDLKLIEKDEETETLSYAANPEDKTYLVPAFSGLGAPYWNSSARAAVTGMSRTTGKAEFVKAALSCIAYQVTDVVKAMEEDSGLGLKELRTDGGPVRNRFLMQLQSDILGKYVMASNQEELSGIGAAYAAGLASGLYDERVFDQMKRTCYQPAMNEREREEKYLGWRNAVKCV